MTIQTNECPEKKTLIDYMLGKLSLDVLESYESHFAQCDECEDTIRGLNVNDTLSKLTMEAASNDQPNDPEDNHLLLSLIDRLQQGSDFDRQKQALQDRAAEVTRLLDSSDDPSSIGQLGHYKIVELIGAGSTGVVYRALDEQLQRVVALKILRPSLGQAARERFMAEARAAAGIDHPNVITIYQVGDEESLAYMAMQWLPGETLEERLKRVTFLAEEEVNQIGAEIASGLQAAHERNLIHRDIKPANIWLREETGQAIILDFGLARIADDDPQLTNTGMLAGTPNFMSPEQTRGLELDGRSDLFSLGCLLYHASTGKLPFGSTGILATLQSIQTHLPSSPSELNPCVSDELSDLIMCLLEKQPVNRPENPMQLIAALGKPRSEWPFVAATSSPAQPKPKPKPKPSIKPKTRSGSAWIRWIAAAICLGFIGWTSAMYGHQIVRIMTDKGELIIDTKDQDVKVEISGNEFVQVIDTKTNQSIDIRSGQYHLKIIDDRNAFQLSDQTVIMTRGGKQIVTITKAEPKSTEPTRTIARAQAGGTASIAVKSDEVFQAELELAQAQQDVVRARAALDHSKPLFEKGYITPQQVKQDEMGLVTAEMKLEQAKRVLQRAKSDQVMVAKQQREIDQLVARKIAVLKENYEAAKTRYESGVVSIDELKSAEIAYLDAKLNLLGVRGNADPASGAENSSSDMAAGSDDESTPTYDGMKFEQWIPILRTERNLETIRSGLKAIGELSFEKPQLQQIAVETVRPIVRKHGSNIIRDDAGLVREINGFFSLLPAEEVIAFALNELENGTLKSRKQATWLLRNSFVTRNSSSRDQHLMALKASLPEILSSSLKQLEDSNKEEAKLAYDLIMRVLSDTSEPVEKKSIQLDQDFARLDESTVDLLTNKMRSTRNPYVGTAIAVFISAFDRESGQAWSSVNKALADSELPGHLVQDCFELVSQTGDQRDSTTIQPLIELYRDENQCNRIADELNRRRGSGVDTIRTKIIGLFNRMGVNGSDALPLLDEVAAGSSQQQLEARNAASRIRQLIDRANDE